MLSSNGQAMSSLRFPQLSAILPVSAIQIGKALNKMKWGKAAGPPGIAKMLKAVGEEGVKLIRKLAEAVFSSGMIPVDQS